MKLPIEFEKLMKSLLGDKDFEKYLKSFNEQAFSCLRVNNLKINNEDFEKLVNFDLEKVPWVHNGYYYNINKRPSRHPYYHAGLYYIQEPSAMTPAHILPINKGDKVLDLCAAPGGKTTELGSKLQGEGLLVANDISASRAKALIKNIEIFGIKNAVVTCEEPYKLAQKFKEFFDKILVDAPCSGEGMFRKEPNIIKNWEQYGIDYYNNIQKEIIIHAANMLKPNGYMVYSTCTFSPKEDEGTIKYLLENDKTMEVVSITSVAKDENDLKVRSYEGFDCGKPEWIKGCPDELKNAIRLWPHRLKGEGHFVVLLRKKDTNKFVDNNNIYNNNTVLPKEAQQFLDNTSIELKDVRYEIFKDKIFAVPDICPLLKGIRVLKFGLYIGDIKKNRFEPSQSFANALKMEEFMNVVNLSIDDNNVIKYLKGETIELEKGGENGWILVCVDGFPLGFGKLNGTTLKNKYHQGWRLM